MINAYKYKSVRACGDVLAEMVSMIGDYSDATIVALPTILKHIRERGFDHTRYLADRIAYRCGANVGHCLSRANSTVQVGATMEMRKEQAKKAYMISGLPSVEARYVLLDDV